MNIPPVLKNKWVLIGGGAVILIALFASSAKGGGNGQIAVTTSRASDSELAAQRDITIASLNAQAAGNASNAQLALATRQGDLELARATMDNELSRYAIDAQLAQQANASSTARDIQFAMLASDERREMAGLNANAQVAKWTLDQATANAMIVADFQLGYAEAANQTQISLAQMSTQLSSNMALISRDVTLAGLASQENMAQISAGLQRDITSANLAQFTSMINADVEKTRIGAVNETEQTRIQASLAKKQSKNNMIGNIIGGALSIFSDRRLKSDVTKIAEYPDGLGVYTYGVPWADGMQHGVMADEVERLRPWAMGPEREGFSTVNYAALGN